VEADNPHVFLHTWNHILWGMSPRTLMQEIRKVNGITLQKVNTVKSFEPPTSMVTQIRLADGAIYLAILPPGLVAEVRSLHGIVNCYKERASLDRTSQTLVDSLRQVYAEMTALIIFPRFEIQTVLKLAGQGSVLPTGITRFTVSPRGLHLNYPLHELSSGKTIEYKEAYLQQWVQERVKNKGIRYYAEATFLFDE
jgi:hypothetical protein